MERVSRRKLLHNLKCETYCRVGVSKIPGAGVGVIAIKDIPEGTNPFSRPDNAPLHDRTIPLSKRELKRLNPAVRELVTDFFIPVFDEKGNPYYPVAQRGLNGMDISFYLNHNDNPNLGLVSSGGPYYDFQTTRKINKGEELFINYFNN